MIKAVIFDLGDTVFVPDWTAMNQAMLNETGVSIILSPDIKEIYSNEVIVGRRSMKDIFGKIIETTGKIIDANFVVQKYAQNYNKYTKVNDKMILLIKSLKNKYKLYGLSNTNEIHGEVNKKRKLFSYFDKVFLSYELGMRKPSEELYFYVLKDINFSPNEVLFIDDKQENIDVAKKLGVNVIKYENYDKLASALANLGLY